MATTQLVTIDYVDTDFMLPELKVLAPGVSDDMLKHFIRKAAIQFAKRSQCLVREYCFNTQAHVTDYKIHLDENEQFVSIQDHSVEGSHNGLRPNTLCNGYTLTLDAPPRVIRVHPAPTKSEKLCVDIAVAPSLTACRFDTNLVEVHHDGILDGARAYLHALPKQKDDSVAFDKNLVPFYESKFENAIAAAGIDRITGLVRGAIKLKRQRSV